LSRTLRDPKLDTRSAREKLDARREPHWRSLSGGTAVGYRKSRKPKKAGTWIAKHYTPEHGRRYRALGAADDVLDADGKDVLTFAQAQQKAHEWFEEIAAPSKSAMSVRQAATAYIDYLRDEKKTADDTELRFKKHLYSHEIADRPIVELTKDEIDKWKRRMIRRDPNDPEVERRSKDSANRVLTMLKAALNRTFNDDDNRIPSDAAWRKVRPFKGVGRARQVHLDTAQATRLINTTEGAFRNLVTAALLTGARPPHELAGLRVRDFHADLGTLSVDGKTGPRDIVLTEEGIGFFREIMAIRSPDALLLPRDDGKAWGKNHHIRPMQEAVGRAKLPDDTTVYSLRHTYASQSILAGMNLKLLAENMGTSIRMLEQHYAKFIAASKRKLIDESGFRLGLKRGKVERIA
jgi:integrase